MLISAGSLVRSTASFTEANFSLVVQLPETAHSEHLFLFKRHHLKQSNHKTMQGEKAHRRVPLWRRQKRSKTNMLEITYTRIWWALQSMLGNLHTLSVNKSTSKVHLSLTVITYNGICSAEEKKKIIWGKLSLYSPSTAAILVELKAFKYHFDVTQWMNNFFSPFPLIKIRV